MAKHILVTGMVHGVGFRPFVYALANRLDLHGWVCNTSSGVEILIEGSPSNIESFIKRLTAEKPPWLGSIPLKVRSRESCSEYQTFDIVSSTAIDGLYQSLPTDHRHMPRLRA